MKRFSLSVVLFSLAFSLLACGSSKGVPTVPATVPVANEPTLDLNAYSRATQAMATLAAMAALTLAPAPTATLAPTDPPEPTATQLELSPTPTPVSDVGIPGLHPADVKTILEMKGFKCGSLSKPAAVYIRTCTLDKTVIVYTVSVYGRTINTVDSVEAIANQLGTPTDDLVAPVFGFVSTFAYNGAEPDVARAWVEATLPKLGVKGAHQTTNFGGVKFDLYGEPTARSLDIGVVDTAAP